MIRLTQESCIYLAVQPFDFRKQLDGLVSVCENQFKQSTRTGNWFVFINRARTMIRALVYDHNGYWLATKRLSRGRYLSWPKSSESLAPCVAAELMRLLKNEREFK
jgi:transposase